MRFALRRSSLATESIFTEPEPRRRNRLSKPLTGNGTKLQGSLSASAINLSVPAQHKNASATDLASAGPLSPTLGDALRHQIRTEMLSPENDGPPPVQAKKNDSSRSVAYIVSQIEEKTVSNASPQQEEAPLSQPLTPVRPKPQKRKSLLLRRLSMKRSSSLSRTPSGDRISDAVEKTPTPPPDTSVDRVIADSPSIPPTRRASFTPGAATRKLYPTASNQDKEEHKMIEEGNEFDGSVVESDYASWQPPPPRTSGRAGTPSDMGYSQLGGLRHGSLQIVNGRASPALSEVSKMSRQLLALPTPHRDVSSEYGDGEDEDEEPSLLLQSTIPNDMMVRRIFSWEKDDDKPTPARRQLQVVGNLHEETEPKPTEDHTSLMAKEYISELGNSPFEQPRSDSPVGTIRRTRSEGSLWRESTCSSLHRSPSVDPDTSELSPVSPIEHSLSPSGSVIRKTSTETARSGHRQLHLATNLDREVCDSVMSWYSPVDPSMPIDEAFSSAVEFQVQISPPRIALHPPRAPEKSDSGYSSNNSLRSLQLSKGTPPPMEIEALPEVPDSMPSTSTPGSSRPPSFLGIRPSILKSRKTEPVVPTFANFRPQMMQSNFTPVTNKTAVPEPESVEAKPTKARKKLTKKKRPLSQPSGQISVARVQSLEHINIPQVPLEVQENLRLRSQAVPELRQTYVTPDLPRGRRSISNLDLSTEIRFPSPGPDKEPAAKRSRSRSRPRSWFGRAKNDIPSSRHSSGISQNDAMSIINHFGTDGAGLGKSPYDLSQHITLTHHSKARSVVSAVTPHARHMMDDETAIELSRQRSRSLRDRDRLSLERRPSFNDRGGIPGRSLRPASIVSEAPPITPEMLAKAYRTCSMQRQFSTTADAPPRRTSSMQWQASMTPDVPPPPPPHSTRPTRLDYQENESAAIAPPPPSHSPRPIDITPDPWAAQAAMWEARRKNAGETLRRQSWDSRKYEKYHEDVEKEPLYPAIPARQQSDWSQNRSAGYNTQSKRSSLRQAAHHPTPETSYGHPTEHESAYNPHVTGLYHQINPENPRATDPYRQVIQENPHATGLSRLHRPRMGLPNPGHNREILHATDLFLLREPRLGRLLLGHHQLQTGYATLPHQQQNRSTQKVSTGPIRPQLLGVFQVEWPSAMSTEVDLEVPQAPEP
ncbi:hypothetical protein H2200_013203 [Cladophialophora chaetospira]|uniref:Proteophosphoglycan ppg4 n=1 Tax=Cladophialophora chaetospira TaxID=386627 RepID=A0AA38WWC4_9EURO|nr:hypothetical protein H2200_013203 [Cladophialophora chaetospira]